MPKASRVGKARQTAKAATSVPPNDNDAPLSRGQKKRLAKREQYLRREKLVMASLKLKRDEDQAKRIDGLDAMKAALMATTKQDDPTQPPPQPSNNLLKSQKSRQKLLQRESNQLQLVLEHPAFQADPLATIREHLTHSLATQAAAREQEQKAHHERQIMSDAKKTHPVHKRRKRHRVRPTRSKK